MRYLRDTLIEDRMGPVTKVGITCHLSGPLEQFQDYESGVRIPTNK